MTPDEGVPSPIDFHDLTQARAWEAETVKNRPYRPQFFATFAQALNEETAGPLRLLELGSGPGHLTEHIFSHCLVERYVALDFSDATHGIARQRLVPFPDKIEFVVRDFRDANWGEGLGPFEAVLTMQAAHEIRHKRHLPQFLARVRQCIRPHRLLLYCDHYAGDGKNSDLFLAAEEQARALSDAGFTDIRKCLDLGGMALFAALNPAGG